MKKILYYIVLPFIYVCSKLPLSFLYRLSDVLYIIVRYGLKYRQQVIDTNLQRAFPNKTEEARIQIRHQFYQYFCDLIVETIKSLTITEEVLKKRVTLINLEVFQKYYKKKQSIIVVMGHLGNWEWAGLRFAFEPVHQVAVLYHPLKNAHFDQLLIRARSRFGNELIPMKKALRTILQKQHELKAFTFIADQTPPPENALWLDFLNQETPVFAGTEKIAFKLDYPVIYVSTKRIKRGYYELTFEQLVQNAKATKEGEITTLHTNRLAEDIQAQPMIWLWSHRRWKHKKVPS